MHVENVQYNLKVALVAIKAFFKTTVCKEPCFFYHLRDFLSAFNVCTGTLLL